MTWCDFLHVPCAWHSLCFLDLWVYSFQPIWKISGTTISITHLLGYLNFSMAHLRPIFWGFACLFIVLILFLLCVTFWIVSITALQFTSLLFCSYLTCYSSHSVYFSPHTLQLSSLKILFVSYLYLSCLFLFEHNKHSYNNCFNALILTSELAMHVLIFLFAFSSCYGPVFSCFFT